MPKPSTTHRMPTATTTAEDRKAGLAAPDDATETLAAVDTSRPLGARDGEHGHIDGPRGLQDFHDHPGGDRPHPHKGTSSLGRTASIDEYVPPLAATDPPGVDQTADPTPAGIPGAVGASPVATAPDGPAPIGSGSGAAGAGRSLQPVDDPIGDHNDKVIAAFVQHIAGLAETERHARQFSAEVEIVTALARLSALAARQLHGRQLVDADVIRQGKQTFDRWAAGRGVSA